MGKTNQALELHGLLFLPNTKCRLLKITICLLLFATLFLNCNLSGHKKDTDDSLQYYPPTPAELDKNEFRQLYRELSECFDTSLLNKGFNGGILIAKNGAVIYEKYQGLVDLRKKDLPAGQAGPLTDSTPLHIASTTKTFTSVAVLRLVQENKLSLNDTITKFFPAFPYPGITVKMLLNHRSGLPNYLYYLSNGDWDKKKYALNQDVLNFLITKKPTKSFTSGTRFSYCNTNYVLLALIIEQITGKSFPEYMQQKFFGPLQMNHTYVFTLKDTLTATPSFTNNSTYWGFDFLDGTYGDKNVYTTPKDLLKWDQALYTDQILSKKLLDSAFSGYSFEKPTVHNYGLGWRMETYPGDKKIVYHFGKWHGFNAAYARLPDEKVTIIILGNRFSRSIYNTAHRSYAIFGYDHVHSLNEDDETEVTSGNKNPAKSEIIKKTSLPKKVDSKAKR